MISLLIRLLERYVTWTYKEQKEDRRKEWLLEQFESEGFKDYFKWRDYALLKTLGQGLDQKDYLITVGRRLELLFLLGHMKEEYDKLEKERKKSKRIDAAKGNENSAG